MRQGVATFRQRVSEKSGIEIHADPPRFRPVDPVAKVVRLERVAFDFPTVGLGVARMQIQSVRAGQERERLLEIESKLIRGARFTGISSGDGQASSDFLV